MKDYFDLLNTNAGNVNILPIIDMEPANKLKDEKLPDSLPILTLRNVVVFPSTVQPVTIGRDKSKFLIREIYKTTKILGTATQKDVSTEDPNMSDLFEIGSCARILKLIDMPDGNITAILQGIKRFNLVKQLNTEPYLFAKINWTSDFLAKEDEIDMKALAATIKDAAVNIIKLNPGLPKEASLSIKNIDNYEFLINFLASGIEMENYIDKIKLLRENDLKKRAIILLGLLQSQIEILNIKEDIQKKVHSEMDQQQREYYLNNQLKTIQEELGIDSESNDIQELNNMAADKKWPDYVAKTFESELNKLERTNQSSPDYSTQYQYIKLLVELPWDNTSKDHLDLKRAQKILDHDHFGLEKVKERIIEYLSVLKLKGDMKSPILCLYGPPGVGKTSLGKSIARSLGRKYQRISLGGLHDESEIRGHRRTYIGAMPGRIIESIKRAGTSNPVLVLDEVDKINRDIKGDPSYALLEVLDPEQNNTFHDNYLDIDYDLSKVMFITTANDISSIHPALRDRMEMIEITGYLPEEKTEIAKRHLVPKELKANGLKSSQIKFSKNAIRTIIDKYTQESGVRGLEKQIAKAARVTARKIAVNGENSVTVKPDMLKEFLGLPTSHHDMQKGNEGAGVVTGLAWTQVGGEILFIECCHSEGKGMLSTTGNLGDVMKESAKIGYEYIKSHTRSLGLKISDLKKKDIHIHVPEGAIPKDGPSAGITMVTAMISSLTGKKVKKGTAMTGEMTLRGKVLPVGGIKEKILAAKRAGITTIVLSVDNKKDIEEIKEIYIKGMNFHFVETVKDVLNFVF
ncbi:MAG: endopeptidase La [Bacteroidales bacterium]